MSSALLEVKVYSSPLMVASVKLGAASFAPLQDQHGEQGPVGVQGQPSQEWPGQREAGPARVTKGPGSHSSA